MLLRLLSLFLTIIILNSCATVFKGYEDEVNIIGASSDLEVVTDDGFVLKAKEHMGVFPVEGSRGNKVRVTVHTVNVPLDRNYILHLKDGNREYNVRMTRKLSYGWFILDFAFFVFPAVYDAMTGAWYYYDDIYFDKLQP